MPSNPKRNRWWAKRAYKAAVVFLALGCVLLLAGAVLFPCLGKSGATSRSKPARNLVPENQGPIKATGKAERSPRSLAELLAIPLNELEGLDAGLINLLCAEGLRGSEDLDIQKCLDALDGWARRVEFETKRHSYRFREHPELFCNSLGYFRMQMLGDVLVHDLRMRYNPERGKESEAGLKGRREEDRFFSDSTDIFIHGLLDGDRYGTCASMPFLYVAIARRLGYPVNLAATQEHLYVRYEEPTGQHINIEATAVGRFKTPPDDYYRDMCAPRSAERIEAAGWLRPLSDREIIGHSLSGRAACLRSTKRFEEELKTWQAAAKYLPLTDQWLASIQSRQREAEQDADIQKRNVLWNEVETLGIPHGPGFVYFRDKKIRLHLLMNRGLDSASVEKAVAEFKTEIEEFAKPAVENSEAAAPLQLATASQGVQVPQNAACFRFREPDEEFCLPDDLLPPNARGGLAPDLVKSIFAQHLDTADGILNFIWDNYENRTLRAELASEARVNALINGPQPLLIARETVPPEYWDNIPSDLAARLQGLTDPREIIGEIHAYDAEVQIRERDKGGFQNAGFGGSAAGVLSDRAEPKLSANARQYLPAEYQDAIPPELAKRLVGKSGPLSTGEAMRYQREENNRKSIEHSKAILDEFARRSMLQPALSFRLVPAALLNGQQAFQPAPPPNPDLSNAQDAASQTPKRTTIGKGNP